MDASAESIPQINRGKYYPKPWWDEQLKESKNRREILYQKYRLSITLQNLLQWKRKRAEHNKLIKESKKKSWIEFVTSLNYETPVSALCQKMRRIKGKAQRKVNILKENGQLYTTIPEIASKLADTFSAVSSNINYTNDFMTHKTRIETQQINFSSESTEIDNRPFEVEELEYCLSNTKNTALRMDRVHYKMIKNMPDTAKQDLAGMFNKFYKYSFFPI